MTIKNLYPAAFKHEAGTCICAENETKKMGRWIVEVRGNGWNDWYDLICPDCGERIEQAKKVPRYCPNCGENMEISATEK